MKVFKGPFGGIGLSGLLACSAFISNMAIAQETTQSCIRAYMLDVKSIGRELQGAIADCRQASVEKVAGGVAGSLPELPNLPNLPNFSGISQCMLEQVNSVQDFLADARVDFDSCIAAVEK